MRRLVGRSNMATRRKTQGGSDPFRDSMSSEYTQYYRGGASAMKTITKSAWKDSLTSAYNAGAAAARRQLGATVGPSVDAGKPYPRVRPTPKSPKLPSGSVQPYNVRTAPKGSLRGMIPTGVTSNVPAIRRGYGVSGRLQGLGSALDAMSRYMKNLKR